MNTLFVAFKGKNNTSYQLISETGTNKLFLTNSFQGLEKDIASLDRSKNRIILIGADKHLSGEVRIETCAEYNGESVKTNGDLKLLTNILEGLEIPFAVSTNPSRYFCNAAYYFLLKETSNTILIHIPTIKGMSDTLRNRLILFVQQIAETK